MLGNVPLGTHMLTAVAHDNGGLSTTSAVVTVNVLATFSAYEPFNYGLLGNGTPTTADGFTGNWTCVPAPSIVSGLGYSGLPTTGSAMSSGGGRQFVSFAGPLSSGTEWISFLCNQTGDPGAVNNGVYFPNGGAGLFFGFGLAPLSPTQGSMRLGSINTTGAGYQSAALLSSSPSFQDYGTTYLVVLKIEFNTSGANDTITVYIDPLAGTNAPGVAADQVVSSFDVGTITGIGVNVGNTAFTVDEIRRANNYADVVGGTVITPAQPALSISPVAGNQFTLSWPAGNLGWFLQTQTNSLNAGLSTNWVDVPGSETSAQSVITIDPANPTLFFRLRSP